MPINIKDNWNKELDHEIEFWDKWFSTSGLTWGEDFKFRMDRNSKLQEHLIDCLPESNVVKILDVGAGPLTVLGKKHEGKQIYIMAVDPMADAYSDIVKRHNVMPIVPTVQGEAENLDFITDNVFDIVYCQNALDHSYDPIKALFEMLRVCNVGGYICMLHETNEGVNEGYQNLHQWNFCKDKGTFTIWNNQELHVVDDIFKDKAIVTIHESNGYNTVKMKKI